MGYYFLTKNIPLTSAIDTDFTPKELVRWDPTLIGTTLYVKNKVTTDNPSIMEITLYQALDKYGILTSDGLLTYIGTEYYEGNGHLKLTTENNFEALLRLPIRDYSPHKEFQEESRNMLKEYGLSTNNIVDTRFTDERGYVNEGYEGYVTLIPDNSNMFESISIVTYAKFNTVYEYREPFMLKQYALMRLYEEWKEDKAQGRPKRYARLRGE
jgi:hypothetical protein